MILQVYYISCGPIM